MTQKSKMKCQTQHIGTVDENPESPQEDRVGNTASHGYNLGPRPTKCHERLNLMQVAQQSTYTDNTKPHLHVLMTQMSMKAGIKKFGKKESCDNCMTERQWC